MLNFVFENKEEMQNLFSPKEKIGGLTRVVLSPYVNRLRQIGQYYNSVNGSLDDNLIKFYEIKLTPSLKVLCDILLFSKSPYLSSYKVFLVCFFHLVSCWLRSNQWDVTCF